MHIHMSNQDNCAPQYLALILQNGAKIAWFKPMFCWKTDSFRGLRPLDPHKSINQYPFSYVRHDCGPPRNRPRLPILPIFLRLCELFPQINSQFQFTAIMIPGEYKIFKLHAETAKPISPSTQLFIPVWNSLEIHMNDCNHYQQNFWACSKKSCRSLRSGLGNR